MHVFPPSHRLLRPAHYKRVFGEADIKVADRAFLIIAVSNCQPHARLGLAVSKRHIRRAWRRNRCKRLVRESFRLQNDLPDIDAVFIARHHLDVLSNVEVFKRLDIAWKKLNSLYSSVLQD